MERECFKCKDIIPIQRLKILPKTNVCVNCSSANMYKGTPVQLGEGDHTWNQLLIQGSNSLKID